MHIKWPLWYHFSMVDFAHFYSAVFWFFVCTRLKYFGFWLLNYSFFFSFFFSTSSIKLFCGWNNSFMCTYVVRWFSFPIFWIVELVSNSGSGSLGVCVCEDYFVFVVGLINQYRIIAQTKYSLSKVDRQ